MQLSNHELNLAYLVLLILAPDGRISIGIAARTDVVGLSKFLSCFTMILRNPPVIHSSMTSLTVAPNSRPTDFTSLTLRAVVHRKCLFFPAAHDDNDIRTRTKRKTMTSNTSRFLEDCLRLFTNNQKRNLAKNYPHGPPEERRKV